MPTDIDVSKAEIDDQIERVSILIELFYDSEVELPLLDFLDNLATAGLYLAEDDRGVSSASYAHEIRSHFESK